MSVAVEARRWVPRFNRKPSRYNARVGGAVAAMAGVVTVSLLAVGVGFSLRVDYDAAEKVTGPPDEAATQEALARIIPGETQPRDLRDARIELSRFGSTDLAKMGSFPLNGAGVVDPQLFVNAVVLQRYAYELGCSLSRINEYPDRHSSKYFTLDVSGEGCDAKPFVDLVLNNRSSMRASAALGRSAQEFTLAA